VQWELRDALADGEAACGVPIADRIPPSRVAAPPRFAPGDVLDAAAFAAMLREGPTRAARELRGELETIGCRVDGTAPDAAGLAAALNRLLCDRFRFRRYAGWLRLRDLRRPRRGPLGIERREMPDPAAYPNGLRAYQAARVNRLIVEAVCPAGAMLAPAPYLSTQDVLDILLPRLLGDRFPIRRVFIYAHPEHASRCRRQTLRSLRALGLRLPEADVVNVHRGERWPWDARTAQASCGSLEAWNAHERERR
jgi:hypothetical protein